MIFVLFICHCFVNVNVSNVGCACEQSNEFLYESDSEEYCFSDFADSEENCCDDGSRRYSLAKDEFVIAPLAVRPVRLRPVRQVFQHDRYKSISI